MDRITEALLQTFVTEQHFELLKPEDAFERFCNFCVVFKDYPDTFDINDVSCGPETVGIDGLAIIVNGSLVTSKEEVQDLIDLNGYLEVTFIFVQAKTSASFDAADIGGFTFGVKDFFNETPNLLRSDFIKDRVDVQDFIYSNSAKFSRGKPVCKLYYVTTGSWKGDPNVAGRITAGQDDLRATQLFREVTFEPVDADGLQRLYQATTSKVSADFQFPFRTVLPDINGVTEAYLGVLQGRDYLRLITDDLGNIRKSLFYDNVRDFQDYNDVNKDVRTTLQSDHKDRFAVLNNGVTIVAKVLTPTANRFHIEDYQIVNGCQTSHVLFNERDEITDNVYVPIKIIATTDDNLTTEVIKGTNNQTSVRPEELTALSDFQKKLEAYYKTFDGKQRLYYERRSGQYNGVQNIEKVRIVTRPNQIRAFAAMFLDEPHRAGRYYGTLLRSIGGKIFSADHRLLPYYTSAYALYKLEYLFRNGSLPGAFRPTRYQTIMAFRYQQVGANLHPLNSGKNEAYCEQLISVLLDDGQAVKGFEDALNAIQKVAGRAIDRDLVKTQTFTDDLRKVILGLP